MQARYSVLTLALLGALSHAQQTPTQPAPVPTNIEDSKTAAPALSAQDRAALQKIPLGNAVQALQADEPRIVVDRRPATAASTPAGAVSKSAPPNYRPRHTALSATGAAGVGSARPWVQKRNAPAAGDNGRVMYVFGKGMPEIVCAPLRICTLELQPGEHVVAEPQIGDSVRWHVTPSVYGQGPAKTELVVIKPQEAGLDTNLVLTTDRRVYYIRLVGHPTEYMPRVAFSYPDDDRRAWKPTSPIASARKKARWPASAPAWTTSISITRSRSRKATAPSSRRHAFLTTDRRPTSNSRPARKCAKRRLSCWLARTIPST
jgi:type IV secretion system protein VirB9